MSLDSSHAKRAAIIFNPVARGLLKRRHLLQSTIGTLASQDIEAKLVATEAPGSAGPQARQQIEAGADLIIAAGGDGTINEVANGMLYTGVPLAILPGGTANVLAREIGLPINLDRAAAEISRLEPYRMAVGSARSGGSGQRCFLCMAGVGLDADIVSRIDLKFKALAGKLAYYVTGFSQVFRALPEFDVLVDGAVYKASFALISRVRNYGGDLEIARGASLLRSDFEIVLFRGTASVRYVPYLLGVALGRVERMGGCTVLRGNTVTCPVSAGATVLVQLDGELADSLPITADILPDALTILLPPAYVTREQSKLAVSASKELAQNGRGVQARRPKAERAPFLYDGAIRALCASEEHVQNGHGVELAAQRFWRVPLCMAARIRALCALVEGAQNGRGVKRAARRPNEFLFCMAARIRALCALV